MSHTYTPALVVLSVYIAMHASYAALDLAGRVQASVGRARAIWILGGAVAMGIGIWSMHFVAMLAFHLPTQIAYSAPLVVLSVAVAIAASAFALWTASRPNITRASLGAAAVAMGIAIAGMHYIGMAAMEVNALVTWDTWLVLASIGIAVSASYVALILFRLLGANESARLRRLRIAAAVVMGFAIAGMHYTGMAAAHFMTTTRTIELTVTGLPPLVLAIAVGFGGVFVTALALAAAMLDRLLQSRTLEAELRAAKDAAERTSHAKSEFLSNMSHELRTPLNSVIGFANILLKNKSQRLSQDELAYLGRIVANGKHLLGLINGILDLSKIEAGRMELEITQVDVGALVRETVLELEGDTLNREVVLAADVPADLEMIEVDRAKLKQILINLIGNALKFTTLGSVTVRALSDPYTGRLARIDVVDTGIGIAASRLDAVFEAFQQADGSTARQYGGTGLGLTITRSLAQMMGFEIRVTSRLGSGSTFSLVPEACETEARVSPTNVPDASECVSTPVVARTGAPLALVIDDDPDARIVLAHELRNLQYDVATARNAAEGIAIARQLHPDVITLDIMMPRKSGLDALHELKTDGTLRDIPVVIVSMVADEYRGRILGAAGCVAKPVTSEALADVLPRLISALREDHRQRPAPLALVSR